MGIAAEACGHINQDDQQNDRQLDPKIKSANYISSVQRKQM
jgi:hypothetical protein